MPLLSLNLGGGLSVDSVCHLRDRPGLAIQRTFGELFSNAPHFADALRIVLVNRLCEHNSQLISKLLFALISAVAFPSIRSATWQIAQGSPFSAHSASFSAIRRILRTLFGSFLSTGSASTIRN